MHVPPDPALPNLPDLPEEDAAPREAPDSRRVAPPSRTVGAAVASEATAATGSGAQAALGVALAAARTTLSWGGAVAAAVVVVVLLRIPGARGAALASLVTGTLLTAIVAAALAARARRRGHGGEERASTRTATTAATMPPATSTTTTNSGLPMQWLIAPPVGLLGGAAMLFAGALAVTSAESAARIEAGVAATEVAAFGARLVTAHPLDAQLLSSLAPPGGFALLVPAAAGPEYAIGETSGETNGKTSGKTSGETGGKIDPSRPSAEACRAGRAPLPCAAEPIGDSQVLLVGVAPRPLTALVGRLLVRAGVVLLLLLLLTSALARSIGKGLEVATAAAPRLDGAARRVLPGPIARALAARRRAGGRSGGGGEKVEHEDLLRRVGAQLRAPVAEIGAQVDLLQKSGQLTVSQADDVALIRAATLELGEMVDAVLDLSSLQTSRTRIERAPVDLSAIVGEVARGLRPQTEQRGVSLLVETPADLPPVRGDAQRLRQVVTNLVGNAVKFAERGTVKVTLEREGAVVLMSVHDDGPGIAANALPHLFHPFEQAGDARERAAGSGLGLAICKRIVEAHGGAISVESALGAGATFRVRLPLDRSAIELLSGPAPTRRDP